MQGRASCPGRQAVTEIIENMLLVNSNSFYPKYPQFGHAPSEMFSSLVLARRSLENTGFYGRQIINLPGGAHITRAGPDMLFRQIAA